MYIIFTEGKCNSLLPEPYQFSGRGDNGEQLPYNLLNVLHLHQQRANRITSTPKPPGIDPQQVLRERENRLVLVVALHRMIDDNS